MSTTRREILQRRQKGKEVFPKWKTAIEGACHQNVSLDSFLDLEETERLRARFFGKVRDSKLEHRFIPKHRFGELIFALEAKIMNGELTIVLFHSMDRFIGALQLPKKIAFRRVEAIWHVVKEDFCVATSDLKSGLCLEENYYDQSGSYVPEGIYELTAWGEFAFS